MVIMCLKHVLDSFNIMHCVLHCSIISLGDNALLCPLNLKLQYSVYCSIQIFCVFGYHSLHTIFAFKCWSILWFRYWLYLCNFIVESCEDLVISFLCYIWSDFKFDLMILQDDIFLICSNAMQYNAPDTIYFRQVLLNSAPSLRRLRIFVLSEL